MHTAEQCCEAALGAKEATRSGLRTVVTVLTAHRLFHSARALKEMSVAPTISAKEGTLARKRQIRDFMEYSVKACRAPRRIVLLMGHRITTGVMMCFSRQRSRTDPAFV